MTGIKGMNGNEHTQWAKNLYEKVVGASNPVPVNQAVGTLAAAQVQATLALAYEQRTANLIAFYAAKEINTHITGCLGLNEWTQS